MPDPPQVSLTDGLDGAGQHDIRIKLKLEFFKYFRQGRNDAHAQRIVQEPRAGDGILLDGIIYRLVFVKKCVQVGKDKNGRFAGVAAAKDADRVSISIGGDFIDLEFGQSLHEQLAAPFFSESRCWCLPDEHDVGNNDLPEGFDLIDQAR